MSEFSAKSTEGLWSYFKLVKEDIGLNNVFASHKQNLSAPKDLKPLMMKTENFFDGQIKFSYAKFAAATNKSDPSDTIDPKNLNFKAYQKRVGNLILEIIYENSNKKIALGQFIKDSWTSNQYPIVGFIPSVDATENNSIELQGEVSPPFLLSNTSFNEDQFQLKNIPMPDELEISEIKAMDDYLHGSSIGKSEINFGFDETCSLPKIEEYPQITVKAPKEDHELEILNRRNKKKRKTQKEEEWLSKNVIKEASNSEISDSNNIINQEESFLPSNNAFKQNVEIKSITGIKSHINKHSYSESSDPECQKTSFFNKFAKNSEEKVETSAKLIIKENSSNEAVKPSQSSSDDPIKVEESLIILPEFQEKSPWFTLSIASQMQKFKDLFTSFSTTGELVSFASLPILFEKTLKALKIDAFDHYRELFKSISEDTYTKKSSKSQHPKSSIKISFQEFIKMMDLWGEKFQQEQKTVLGSVIRTSSHLNTLGNTFHHLEPLANIIDFTVIQLKECVNEYVHMQKSGKISEEIQKKNLEYVFLFYGKIQKIQGTEPTFEALELSNTAWNLGKFLKFCSDFKIVAMKNVKQRAASKESLTFIFKKNANYTRIMFFPQFITALDRISEVLYSAELDQLLDSNFAYKSLSEKRDLLYSLLEISNFNKIQMKKKPFGTGFSPDKFSRIPKSDPSHKYKFNPNSRVLKDIENWKKVRKEPQAIEEPVEKKFKILSPQPALKKNFRIGVEGYSGKGKDVGKGKDGYRDILKFNSQADLGVQSVVKSRSPEVFSNRMTIKSLYNLKYEDIDDEFELRGLIGHDSDEYVDKIYNVGDKLGRILKMQDDRLARSQKVLEKNKYR